MTKLSKAFNEFFYAWGDNDPEKTVLRYGKSVTLRHLHGYDDYKYYRPRRNAAGSMIILGTLASGYALLAGGKYVKKQFDEKRRKSKKA